MAQMIESLKKPVEHVDEKSATDGQLLTAVVSDASQDCFEELLRRHASMVFGVCTGKLGNRHDAEDAAQAVFLVLWRKANSLQNRTSVAGWLHEVACNVCRNSRKMIARRLARERKAAATLDSSCNVKCPPIEASDSFTEILHEELGWLPEKYRQPLVLCHLEEKSHQEVADETGQNPSTIATRLFRAREMLRLRLEKRGVTLTSAALGAMLTAEACSAAVPQSFITATMKTACVYAAGGLPVTGVLSSMSAELATHAIKTLLISKLKTASAAGLVMLLSTVGVFAICSSFAAPPVQMASDAIDTGSTKEPTFSDRPVAKNEIDTALFSVPEPPSEPAATNPEVVCKTYFVNRKHPEADDSNDGTWQQPWKTINRANRSLKPGDRVKVSAGVYDESIVPKLSGTAGQPIHWEAMRNGDVVLTRDSVHENAGIWLEDLQYVTITGFRIRRVGRGIEINQCKQIAVRQCELDEIGSTAIVVRDTYGSKFVNNMIHDIGDDTQAGSGIVCEGGGSDLYIRSNAIYQIRGTAIELMPTTHNCDIAGNTIHDIDVDIGAAIHIHPNDPFASSPRHEVNFNTVARISSRGGEDGGFGVYLGTGSSAANNIIYDCQGPGIFIDDQPGSRHHIIVSHNTFFANAGGAIAVRDTVNVRIHNNLGVDLPSNMPSRSSYFVDAARRDFHLVVGSTPIDAARNFGSRFARDGVQRPVGAAPDMGAYEFAE